MMKSILDYIRSDSGKKFKINAIKKHGDNLLFRQLLEATYSPFVRYGLSLSQVPKYDYKGSCMALELALIELSRLSNGELKGNAAKEHVKSILERLHPDNAEIILNVINGSLKLGCNVSSINSALGKNFIKEVPYMGAVSFGKKKVEELFNKEEVLCSQVKMDGRFTNVVINKDVSMESRQGLPTYFGSQFDNLVYFEELYGEPVVLNGELMVSGFEDDRYLSNGVVSSIVSIGDKILEGVDVSKDLAKFEKKWSISYGRMLSKLKIVVWDFIPMSVYLHEDIWGKPYRERLNTLGEMIENGGFKNIEMVDTVFVKNVGEANNHFIEQLSIGNEGTILKSLDSAWENKKPSFQVKMKLEIELDFKVTSGNFGAHLSKNSSVISSLNVESRCGLLKTSPSGMSEDMMLMVTENLDDLIGTVVKIKCNGLSQDNSGNWSVLHPVVLEFRSDKFEADSLEDCLAIHESAVSIEQFVPSEYCVQEVRL